MPPTDQVAHEHRFLTLAHLDGCHWYTTVSRCKCGAVMNVTHERAPLQDGWSLIWMEPVPVEIRRDDRGRFCKPHFEERRCDRCAELLGGAAVRSDAVITAKDGSVESERHEEHDQRDEEPPETAQDDA